MGCLVVWLHRRYLYTILDGASNGAEVGTIVNPTHTSKKILLLIPSPSQKKTQWNHGLVGKFLHFVGTSCLILGVTPSAPCHWRSPKSAAHSRSSRSLISSDLNHGHKARNGHRTVLKYKCYIYNIHIHIHINININININIILYYNYIILYYIILYSYRILYNYVYIYISMMIIITKSHSCHLSSICFSFSRVNDCKEVIFGVNWWLAGWCFVKISDYE